MNKIERLKKAMKDTEKRLRYVHIVLSDKRYLEVAYWGAIKKMKKRKVRYQEMIEDFKKTIRLLEDQN